MTESVIFIFSAEVNLLSRLFPDDLVQGLLSWLKPLSNRVEMMLSLLVKDVVWHMLDSLLDLLCAGELEVDVVTDVLVSVLLSVWISVHIGCWSFVATRWAKYWCIVYGMQFVGDGGLVMGLWCSIVGRSGLEIGLPFDVGGSDASWRCLMAGCCMFACSAGMFGCLWSWNIACSNCFCSDFFWLCHSDLCCGWFEVWS